MSKRVRESTDIVSGIYQIKNTINGNVYIGSSKDVYGRWVKHKCGLKNNNHHCAYLQNAWNKYGEDNFEFSILEIVEDDVDARFKAEQYWYDYYLNTCNCNLYNMSKIAKAPNDYFTLEDIKNGKSKLSYDDFLSICTYLEKTKLPCTKIAEIVGVSKRIVQTIYAREEYTKATEGFVFIERKMYGENAPGAKLSENLVIKIVNDLLQDNTIQELSEKYNISNSSISDIYHKRTWKHITKDIEFKPLPNRKRTNAKPILQYDLNGNFIAEYKSAREAERITGINYKLISRVCTGERKHTNRCVFKFKL